MRHTIRETTEERRKTGKEVEVDKNKEDGEKGCRKLVALVALLSEKFQIFTQFDNKPLINLCFVHITLWVFV